ncbi:MAG: gliding motility lipoprotein GldH [Odoribacter sp.]|nr:gliding motility lipoprotein GldH [Odoribacter sp.]
MSKISKNSSVLYMAVLCFLISCSEQAIYDNYQNINDEAWCIGEATEFNFEIPEAGQYQFNIGIRHTTDYEMSNLWCFISLTDSTGYTQRDTINFKLAENDGRWLGKGNILKTLNAPIYKENPVLFPGNYTMKIEQGMRIKCLKGIKNIGLKVEESK